MKTFKLNRNRLILLMAMLIFGLQFGSMNLASAQDTDTEDMTFQELMQEAISFHEEGKLDEAMKYHKRVAALPDTNGIGEYNMACVYSLQENADKAFECLEKSVERGFLDVAQYENDSDLDFIKEDPRFEKLIAVIENGGKPVDEEEDDEAKSPIAGNWKVLSGVRSGTEIPAERLPAIVVTNKTFTIPAGPGAEFVMSYTLDETKTPFEVDMKIESGPAPDGAALGIVSLDGNKMKLCYNPMGGDRPAKFESVADDNCFFFELEKEQPTVSTDSLTGTWEIVEGTRAGADVAAERMAGEIVFEKDTIAMGDGEAAFGMSYTLDTEKSPVEIDMKITSGPAPEGTPAIGIMKMDSDGHLHLCYDGMGGDRPKKFESTEEDGCFFFKLKKKE